MKSWFNQTTWSLCCRRLYFTRLSAVVSDEGFCQQTTYIKVWTCFQASEFVPITDHLCCQHCVPSLCVESESFQPLVLLNLLLLKADPSDLQQHLLMEILLHWIQQLLFFPNKISCALQSLTAKGFSSPRSCLLLFSVSTVFWRIAGTD